MTTIGASVATVRSALVRRERHRALWGLVALTAAAVVLTPLAVGEFATSMRMADHIVAVGALLYLAALGAVIYWYVWRPHRQFASDRAVAHWLFRRHKDVGSQALAGVELAAMPHHASPSLATAAISTTGTALARAVARTDDVLVPTTPGRARTIALATIALAAAVPLVREQTLARGAAMLTAADDNPFVDATWAGEPLLLNLQITITPPAYSGRPATLLEGAAGDLQVLQGSQITIVGTPARAATTVTLLWQPGGVTSAQNTPDAMMVATRMMPMSKQAATNAQQSAAWSGTLVANEPGMYRFMVGGDDGDAHAIESHPHTIALNVDRIPAVQLFAPSKTLVATTRQTMELAYAADDDFGVAAIDLVWEHDGGIERQPVMLDRGRAHHEGTITWNLGDIRVASSPTTVRFYLEARDTNTQTGPGVGRSAPYVVEVTEPLATHDETLAALQITTAAMLRHLSDELLGAATDASEKAVRMRLATLVQAISRDELVGPGATDTIKRAATLWDMLPSMTDRAARLGGIEDSVLELTDWHKRLLLSVLASSTAELRDMMQRLEDLMTAYSTNGDPRLLVQAQRLGAEITRLMERIAKSAQAMPQEPIEAYINPASQTADSREARCLVQVKTLLEQSEAAAALAALRLCKAQWSSRQEVTDRSLAAFRAARFAQEQTQLDALLAGLKQARGRAAAIEAASSAIATSQAGRRPTGILSVEQLARYLRELATVRAVLANVPPAGLTQTASDALEVALTRIAAVNKLLAIPDLFEATQRADLAADSLGAIRDELNDAIAEEPNSSWNDLTQEALANIDEARARMRALTDRLADVRPAPALLATPAERERFGELLRLHGKLVADAAAIGDKLSKATALGAELTSNLQAPIAAAAAAIEQAKPALGAMDAIAARERAAVAVHQLDAAIDMFKTDSRGPSGARRIGLPRMLDALTHESPVKFREDLARAMKAPAPAGTTDLVKRYYEGLIK